MRQQLIAYLHAHATACHLAAIVLLAMLVLLPGTGIMPLLDRDEPRFARATVEMMERGEWIIPYFNAEYRFDKPILTYWLMRVSYALCGVGELGARLHAVVCAILVAIVVYGIGKSWFSAPSGLLAAWCWLTAVQTLIHGRCALADMPMVLGVIVAQWGCHELLARAPTPLPRLPFLACYGGLAFGFLAKGPVAVLVPLLTLAIFRCLAWRRPLPWRCLRLLPGLALTLVLVAIWGVPALIQTQGQFWQIGIHKHVVNRGLDAFNDRAFLPVVYYLATFFFSLYPWSAFAGELGKSLRQAWNEKYAYLTACFAAPYVVFACYATQLPHYVMPGFPAFCLLVGDMLARPRAASPWANRWFTAVMTLFTCAAVAILVLAFALHLPEQGAGVRHALSGAGLVLLALSGLALAWWHRPIGPLKSIATIVAVIAVACGVHLIGFGLRHSLVIVRLSPLIQELPVETRCQSCRFAEPSLVFYGNRSWQMAGSAQELWPLLRRTGAQLAVFKDAEIGLPSWLNQCLQRQTVSMPALQDVDQARLVRRLEKQGYRQTVVEGINLARGTWVRLLVMHR